MTPQAYNQFTPYSGDPDRGYLTVYVNGWTTATLILPSELGRDEKFQENIQSVLANIYTRGLRDGERDIKKRFHELFNLS
jgi:hypothetical protein